MLAVVSLVRTLLVKLYIHVHTQSNNKMQSTPNTFGDPNNNSNTTHTQGGNKSNFNQPSNLVFKINANLKLTQIRLTRENIYL